jgi:hypothetical protein
MKDLVHSEIWCEMNGSSPGHKNKDDLTTDCPSWFERVMARDAATLRTAVVVGCAAFWAVVFAIVFI